MKTSKKDNLYKQEKWKVNLFHVIAFVLLVLSVSFPIGSYAIGWQRVLGITFYVIYFLFFVISFSLICELGKEDRIKRLVVLSLQYAVGNLFILLVNFGPLHVNIVIAAAISFEFISYNIYQVFDLYMLTKKIFKEAFFRVLFVVSLVFTIAGTLLGLVYNANWLWIVSKIGIGIAYSLILLGIMNALFFKQESWIRNDIKKSLYYKYFITIFYVVMVFTFPIYVYWCGLPERWFNYFITLYIGVVTSVSALAGVAWTIKNSENNIRLDNKMKNKPILIMIKNHQIEGDRFIDAKKIAEIKEISLLNANLGFIMKNISQMPCKIVGIEYFNKIVPCENAHMWVEGRENVCIFVHIIGFKYPGKINLVLEDISGNRYKYLLEYDNVGSIISVKEEENE